MEYVSFFIFNRETVSFSGFQFALDISMAVSVLLRLW